MAISYLDRQTLPVAVHAIEKDIPLSNEQFSNLQSMFLFSYALFDGEPRAKDGYVELNESLPGLGLTMNEQALQNFTVIE